MSRGAGTTLLVLLTVADLGFLWGRGFLESREFPASVVSEPPGIRVELATGFPDPGIPQFFDAFSAEGVIRMTIPDSTLSESIPGCPLQDGERLDVLLSYGNIVEIRRGWMASGKRMALGIPLDPDRMTLSDWEALPGIGPSLAARIELDRQNNGDFGSLEALERVKGIGPKRLAGLREFF